MSDDSETYYWNVISGTVISGTILWTASGTPNLVVEITLQNDEVKEEPKTKKKPKSRAQLLKEELEEKGERKIIIHCSNCGYEFEVDHEPDYDEEFECPKCDYKPVGYAVYRKTMDRLLYWGY